MLLPVQGTYLQYRFIIVPNYWYITDIRYIGIYETNPEGA